MTATSDMGAESSLADASSGALRPGPDDRVLRRLPEAVLAELTPVQIEAIRRATADSLSRHPVNLRLSLPLLFRNVFLTVIAGPERRDNERLRAERELHPIRSAGNLLFVMLAVLALYVVALAGILLYASVLEF